MHPQPLRPANPSPLISSICAGQVGDSLEEFLVASTNDAKLRQLLMSMSEAIRTIGFKARGPHQPSGKSMQPCDQACAQQQLEHRSTTGSCSILCARLIPRSGMYAALTASWRDSSANGPST